MKSKRYKMMDEWEGNIALMCIPLLVWLCYSFFTYGIYEMRYHLALFSFVMLSFIMASGYTIDHKITKVKDVGYLISNAAVCIFSTICYALTIYGSVSLIRFVIS